VQIPCTQGGNKKKYFARRNLKEIFCRGKAKLAYFAGVKALFTHVNFSYALICKFLIK
jgi:hypothetical protein